MTKKRINLKENLQKTPAKVNLFLDVVSRRNDGFHNIKTVLAEINLWDNLIFRLTQKDTIKIFCSSKKIREGDNLVKKIINYMKKEYQPQKGLKIVLEKNIPVSAGLGGGSSNAASTIKSCNELWNLQLSKNEMHIIAAKFGSDINFFIGGGLACLSGRGEKVSKITSNFGIENLLLVNPRFSVSSKDAYSWVRIKSEKNDMLKRLYFAIEKNDISALCQNLYNSLEDGVFTHYPIIKKIKEKMIELGAIGSLMSGSGATVFGIFDSVNKMKSAEKYFSDLDYWTYQTKIDLQYTN